MKPTNIRVENWNGHEIRFIEKTQDDWWAIAKDVAKALNGEVKDQSPTPRRGVLICC